MNWESIKHFSPESYIKSYTNLISFSAGFLIVGVMYIVFMQSNYFEDFQRWSENKQEFLFISLVIIKILGIIWPPLPGGVLTLGSIPVLGWQTAYVADLLGSIVGTSLAFVISRKFGRGLLRKILTDEMLDSIEAVKFKQGRQFEVFMLLMLAGGTVIDIMSYAAGLVKSVRFLPFASARLISHLIVGIPSFYFVSNILSGNNVILSVLLVLLIIPIIWRLRHRYLEL